MKGRPARGYECPTIKAGQAAAVEAAHLAIVKRQSEYIPCLIKITSNRKHKPGRVEAGAWLAGLVCGDCIWPR